MEGKVPPPLSEEQLKELILKAIDDAEDQKNPETFHALWGHRSAAFKQTTFFMDWNEGGRLSGSQFSTPILGNGNTTSQPKTLMDDPSRS